MKNIKIITLFLLLILNIQVFAEDAQAPGGSPITQMIILVVFVLVFYMILIRPQQKRTKEHKKLISELKTNDEIATLSGLIGVIEKIEESFVYIKINNNVVIQIQKHAIGQLLPKGSFTNK